MAGAASRQESGPDASTSPEFTASPIRGLVSPAITGAAAAPAAIALRLHGGDGEAETFAVDVTDAYGDTLVSLGTFSDEDVIAAWRRAGIASGLPLLIGRQDGTFATVSPQIGRVQLGEIRIRRRHGLLNGRRPRFLTRRKTGRLPVRPAVHREREIVSGRV
ncbi:MAG TPA: DUF6101 family protein [Beijerinckiaceae bacterium]|jgi:hypothetical protein